MAKRKNWTPEEVDFLESNYGKHSLYYISKEINRTIPSIKHKAQGLRLGGTRAATGLLTAADLGQALATDIKAVIRWIDIFNLKAKRTRTAVKAKYYQIDLKDFWKWAENHQELIKWDKVEKNILGKEPLWVMTARSNCYKKPQNRHQYYTEKEESLLKMYWNSNKPIKEIAILMNRSVTAVRLKAKQIGLKRRVIAIKWKQIENEILIDMKNLGNTDKEVAEELGRSTGSVINQRNKLVKEGRLIWKYRPNKKVAPACKLKEQPISKNSIIL